MTGKRTTADGGLCYAIKANYWKMSASNFCARGRFKATAVLEFPRTTRYG